MENISPLLFFKNLFSKTDSLIETVVLSVMLICCFIVIVKVASKLKTWVTYCSVYGVDAIQAPFMTYVIKLALATVCVSLLSYLISPGSKTSLILIGERNHSWLPLSIQGVMWLVFFYFIFSAAFKSRLLTSRPVGKNNFSKETASLQYLNNSFAYMGMFGTVYGISEGLFLFNKIEDILVDLNGPLFMEIVSALGVAFHTTMLGILMTLASAFVLNRLDKEYGDGVFA